MQRYDFCLNYASISRIYFYTICSVKLLLIDYLAVTAEKNIELIFCFTSKSQ